jgi:HEPN domain-containing protein
MSESKNKAQGLRWLRTAEQDLASARVLAQAGQHANACFLAQQAAEKSVKALLYSRGESPRGHSIQNLIDDDALRGEFEPQDEWLRRAAELDRLYIPTRYPNGLPDLTPGETFFAQDAQLAIEMATAFIQAAHDRL